ncbi:thiol-disulfide oxidoreductase DCC family protein [Saccharopolyspora rectivirgula]|uniref:Thiol-disulfide oxidoreductase n=1 Tax=Saccharopolyspora rectivirgula TaxID=28042 RepID=A0A073B3M0_9PSEU|nr:DUF393 domain-containing protein [Saccharopolyspora rectivirgula]KEI46116.1 thiol-disulfide oxidoreductase [Saccharopolyspora rectivirgula]
MTDEQRTSRFPVLVYDGDCGFCTRCVRWAVRLPVSMRVVPWQETDVAALGSTAERARAEVLWISGPGQVRGGADAVAGLLEQCRFPWSSLGRLLSAPGVRRVADRLYTWVAANRHRFPGSTPACQLPPQERPGS